MKTLEFHEFLDQKKRKARKHLKIVKGLLEQGGFKVEDKMDEQDGAYLFVHNPRKNLSFDGVRVYEIGGELAYRIQKESTTHPYGKAYPLPIDDMFEDLLGEDGMKDEDIGQEIMTSIINELKSFFNKSYEAEKKGPPVSDPLGKIHARAGGAGDYANTATGSGDK
jgi:hypothetical protein